MDSIGELIDKLTIVNIKIFHLVEIVEDRTSREEAVAQAARKSQMLNRDRSLLINEIDERLGQESVRVKI